MLRKIKKFFLEGSKNKLGIIVYDLDYTLLDTKALKKTISLVISDNPDMTAGEIVEAFQDGEKKALIEKILSKSINFGYIADNSFAKQREFGYLILLSKSGKSPGAREFQGVKIQPWKKFFDEVILVDDVKGKIQALKEIIKQNPGKKIHFVNDNEVENEKISQIFGGLLFEVHSIGRDGKNIHMIVDFLDRLYGDEFWFYRNFALAKFLFLLKNNGGAPKARHHFQNKKSLFLRLSSSLIKI